MSAGKRRVDMGGGIWSAEDLDVTVRLDFIFGVTVDFYYQ